jgi:hypothetical protein
MTSRAKASVTRTFLFSGWLQDRRLGLVQLGLLSAILGLHLQSRLTAQQTTPLSERHFYPEHYLVSLSILSGNGFNYLVPLNGSEPSTSDADARGSSPARKGTDPVKRFLRAETDAISKAEFEGFLARGVHRQPIGPSSPGGGWERTRVLDMYLAAGLWKAFGISWSNLFTFYAVVSTGACLLVSFVAAQLAGSRWAGLIGAAMFMASPFERIAGAWSVRDTNPLWFACFAFFLLLRYAEPGDSRIGNCLGWLAIGAGSILGLGWRVDALLLPPFVCVGLLAVLVARRTPLRQVVLAVAICVAGIFATKGIIDALGAAEGGQGSGYGFHVAWFGEHARSDLLLTKNVFQACQDDYLTMYQSNYYRLRRHGSLEPSSVTSDPLHLAAIRAMYLEMARYNAYVWWRRFPAFLASVTRVDQGAMPGPSGQALSLERSAPESGDEHWLRTGANAASRWRAASMPIFFVLGVAFAFLESERRVAALLLAAYFVYYGAALLTVLPESKHWASLLLPLNVLSAYGLWRTLTTLLALRRPGVSGTSWRCLREPLISAGAIALCWLLLGVLAQQVSQAQRRRLVDSVTALAASAPELPLSPEQRKLYTVATSGRPEDAATGYLFQLRGAPRRVSLYSAHIREGAALGLSSSYYYTRHELAPDATSYYFINLVSGEAIGDRRPYTLQVRARGRAEILSVRKLDLSQWRIGLPLGMIYGENGDGPQAGLMDDNLEVTGEFASRQELEAAARLRLE